MEYRELGSTGIRISTLAFGAGPVPALMTTDSTMRQRDTLRAALRAGINWFDTAAAYGQGCSERSLGRRLAELDAHEKVYLATKVRLDAAELGHIEASVRRSLEGSLQRLGVSRIALLQLHNVITECRGAAPMSVTPRDVLGSGGILRAFARLQDEHVVEHLGLTAGGSLQALRQVIDSSAFAALQVPCNVLDFTGGPLAAASGLGALLAYCQQRRMGVLAIRVFAGGALVGQPPSTHTRHTPFFPLELYRRDQRASAGCGPQRPGGGQGISSAQRRRLPGGDGGSPGSTALRVACRKRLERLEAVPVATAGLGQGCRGLPRCG